MCGGGRLDVRAAFQFGVAKLGCVEVAMYGCSAIAASSAPEMVLLRPCILGSRKL
jgi:hypothetical protein